MELTDEELAGLVNVDGHWVDRDVLGIAEKISEYDPNLRVQYLEIASSVGEPPWRVVEKGKDGVDRVVLTAWQLDHTVFDRLIAHDVMNVDVLAEIDKKNNAARKAIKDKAAEQLEEDTRLAHAVLSTSLTDYSVRDPRTGEKIVFRGDGTVKREPRTVTTSYS